MTETLRGCGPLMPCTQGQHSPALLEMLVRPSSLLPSAFCLALLQYTYGNCILLAFVPVVLHMTSILGCVLSLQLVLRSGREHRSHSRAGGGLWADQWGYALHSHCQRWSV